MKFIKIKDELLEQINEGDISTISIINDQDSISIDDKIEFFNDENVAFGIATVNQINLYRLDDVQDNKKVMMSLISEQDDNKPLDNEHIKTLSFKYDRYKEPKSLSTEKDLDTTNLKIYADGGSRGNPGPSASGYVILTEDGKLIKANGVYLGITTNNQAEYKSIKFALQDSLELGGKNIDVYMDSLLVINQLKGTFKIKNEALYPIYRDIKDLVTRFDRVEFTHVPRALNKLADEQVNICLDDALNIT